MPQRGKRLLGGGGKWGGPAVPHPHKGQRRGLWLQLHQEGGKLDTWLEGGERPEGHQRLKGPLVIMQTNSLIERLRKLRHRRSGSLPKVT